MSFKAPTGVVMIFPLTQVQALHIFTQKQPLRNRFVSTKTDFLDDTLLFCVVSRFFIVILSPSLTGLGSKNDLSWKSKN